MTLFNTWENDLIPLLEKYKGRRHPLHYQNLYQLLVMVILSAQDSDANINNISQSLFKTYPNLESLSLSNSETLTMHITKVRNYVTKANWLIQIAQTIKKDENIPTSMELLLAFKGIGRKSANVIIRESLKPAQGIIVDLHVIRVAPRVGLVPESKDGNKVEKQLLTILPQEIWGEIGMSLSFLGREICRPTDPKCTECVINSCCAYYKNNKI